MLEDGQSFSRKQKNKLKQIFPQNNRTAKTTEYLTDFKRKRIDFNSVFPCTFIMTYYHEFVRLYDPSDRSNKRTEKCTSHRRNEQESWSTYRLTSLHMTFEAYGEAQDKEAKLREEPRVENHPIRSSRNNKTRILLRYLACHASSPNKAQAEKTKQPTQN